VYRASTVGHVGNVIASVPLPPNPPMLDIVILEGALLNNNKTKRNNGNNANENLILVFTIEKHIQ
jgi:hypothetical protein